jgi:hypothetical protein
MIAVLLVRDKVDFSQELLLVMLEFPDHGESATGDEESFSWLKD